MELSHLEEKAKRVEKATRLFFKSIKKNRENKLDDVVHGLHKEVFENTDCLACANCCKTLGPRITNRDIEQMASALRLKPSDIISAYLRLDEDNDYVLKQVPCPFLGADHYCSIYRDRPKACREYPHTDRKRFYQIHALSIKNAVTCPAVFDILERLKKSF